MAISFDNAYSAAAINDTVLFNATVAEANSIMVLFNSNTVGYASYNLATVRYPTAGTDATFIGQVSAGNRSIGAWYLVNPTTGTNQVEMAFSSNFDKCGCAYILKAPSLTSQPDSFSTDSSASESTWTLTTSIVRDGAWLVGGWCAPDGTASSGTTERIDQADVGTGSHLQVADGNDIFTAGSHSLEYSGALSEWAGIIVSITPNQTGASPGGGVAYSGGASFSF